MWSSEDRVAAAWRYVGWCSGAPSVARNGFWVLGREQGGGERGGGPRGKPPRGGAGSDNASGARPSRPRAQSARQRQAEGWSELQAGDRAAAPPRGYSSSPGAVAPVDAAPDAAAPPLQAMRGSSRPYLGTASAYLGAPRLWPGRRQHRCVTIHCAKSSRPVVNVTLFLLQDAPTKTKNKIPRKSRLTLTAGQTSWLGMTHSCASWLEALPFWSWHRR
jgi:hypothetical protein